MNNAVLVGRLVKDPELKFAQGTGNAVTTFTIAVNRRFKREGQPEADFIPIVQFGKGAEATANYMTKGKLVSVAGAIQTRTYDAKDGTKRYVTEIIADEVNFLEKKGESISTSEHVNNDEITPVDDGDCIPF
jgi:single-strand DNA-binding protein